MRMQGHGYLNILCRCNIRRSATPQREHGFLLDQPYRLKIYFWQLTFGGMEGDGGDGGYA
jgi:hypothetical protein